MDKKTPQKHSNPSNKHKKIDDALAKDLLSPYYDTLSTSTFPSFTPLNKQP